MQESSDIDLLLEYVRLRSEGSFGELAKRYADFVYSAALRQVNSPDLASDVAQTVFIDLARKAERLSQSFPADASLVGWLYRSTRLVALNVMRGNQRRQSLERKAMENAETLPPEPEAPQGWEVLSPLLDEVISGLQEKDRDALLLRFFQNQDFHKVGLALGISDDAAQKRVSRALKRMRSVLVRRGIATTAAALSTIISTNAMQAAPAGLVAVLCQAGALAGTAVPSTAMAGTKIVAMTMMQKAAIGLTLAVIAGTGIYQARQVSQLRDQLQITRQQQAPLVEQLRRLQQERDQATSRVGALSDEVARLSTNSGELLRLRGQVTELASQNTALAKAEKDTVGSAARTWADRVTQLKQRLEQTPSAAIPELTYLNENNWLNAARDPLVTDDDYRRAFASLRHSGENAFINLMQKALKNFQEQNNQQFPSDIMQLKPYFETPPDDAMLQRYAVVPASMIPNVKMGGDSMITVKQPVDEENDTLWALGPNGFGSTTYRGTSEIRVLAPVLDSYKAANNGQEPKNPSDLLPFLTTPEQQAAYQRLAQMRTSTAQSK